MALRIPHLGIFLVCIDHRARNNVTGLATVIFVAPTFVEHVEVLFNNVPSWEGRGAAMPARTVSFQSLPQVSVEDEKRLFCRRTTWAFPLHLGKFLWLHAFIFCPGLSCSAFESFPRWHGADPFGMADQPFVFHFGLELTFLSPKTKNI